MEKPVLGDGGNWRPSTWTDALDGVLAGLDLAWWAVDGETIQITSRKAADRLQRIEFHTIPAQLRQQFANDEALAAALRAENAAAADLFVLNGTHLIVLGNEIVHRTLTRRLRVE